MKDKSVKERLTALETLTNERWDAHDKRSAENWKRIEEVLRSINSFILGETARRTGCMDETKKYTNKAISWTLGVPATICAIIGVFVMVLTLFKK